MKASRTSAVAAVVLAGGAAVAVHAATDSHAASDCARHAPTTAAAYTRDFAKIPTSQWGGGDVAITVPTTGRDIWLFGDTLSTRPGGFVHSTAIIQTGSCLHVSSHGAQLLPNADAHHIYWIESGRAVDAQTLTVTARAITLTGSGVWGFRDGGVDATALVHVTPAGDLTFIRWTGRKHTAAPNPGPLYSYGPGHIGYARHTHPELRLADGRPLVTTCQNWDDGQPHPVTAYRPIFTG
jgi:hypothetical protein